MEHAKLATMAAGTGREAIEMTVLPGRGFATPWRSFTHVGIPPGGQYDAADEGECEVGYLVLEGMVRCEAARLRTPTMESVEVGAPGVLVMGVAGAHRLTNAGSAMARVLAMSVAMSPGDTTWSGASTPTDPTGTLPRDRDSGAPANRTEAGAPVTGPVARAVDAAQLTWRGAIHGGSGRIATKHLWRPEEFASSWAFIDHAVLGQGGSVGYHYHDALEESFVVLSGKGWMTVRDETFEVGAGSVTFQRIGEGHGIYNPQDADLAFLRLAVALPDEAFTTVDLHDDLRERRPGSTPR